MKLDWLKDIVGETYTEEMDGKAAAELGKLFVSKADFNEKSEELRKLKKDLADRDKQLDELKETGKDSEALRKQIEELQEQNKATQKAHEEEMKALRLDNAVEKALTGAGAKNLTATRAVLSDFLKEARLDESGSVVGLKDKIEELLKDESTSFLFAKKEDKGAKLSGLKPGEPGGNPPGSGKDPKDMSYSELSAYLAANPDAKL